MNPRQRRFDAKYLPMANAIARLDIPQTIREEVAAALTAALADARDPDFKPRSFELLASDPLCACPGRDDTGCPDGTEIRVPMHLSSAPDGRSAVWEMTKPTIKCVWCGMRATA
ncbi:MAG: hypothetical protein EHM63_06025 [Actinobacteria bacterium]|nr:MAG: hypothetical protein EHM63_06025 [Actinomycetota bacterium]